MALFCLYVLFFACVFCQAFPILSRQSNFTITIQKGYSGVFGNETIVGKVGDCYPLQQHKIPSVIHLSNDAPIFPEYTLYGFYDSNCENKSVAKPLKPNVPIFINERKSTRSFSLGKPPVLEVTIAFTHENGYLYATVNNTNCYNISENDELYHYYYPSRLIIYEGNGTVANNFVRLYSGPDCLYENILSHRNGSEEIKTGDDLFELSLLNPISVAKYFSII